MSPKRTAKAWSPHVEEHGRIAQSDGHLEAVALNRGDVWFDDGTIILEVEGSHFRVFEGVLALHSPLFNNLPHYLPVDAISCERKIYGVRVLALADDPKDWGIVLSVLFDPHEQRKL